MKSLRIVSVLAGCALAATLAAPASGSEQPTSFGAPIAADAAATALSVADVMADPTAHAGKTVRVAGKTDGVCVKKGCWMTLEGKGKAALRVTFRDYGFFVPQEILGQNVVIEGKLEIKEQSVAELRHLAEDAGRPAAEIEAITAPKKAASLVADGVVIVEPTQ